MANDLAVIENTLMPLRPQLHQVLGGIMEPERLIRTIIISCERTEKLRQCTQQSIINGAMTFGVLGLEVDGATGQGYLLPFEDRRKNIVIAQPCIGYRGYNSLGARARLTITGEAVYEHDDFDYLQGTGAFVRFKKSLLPDRGRMTASWAMAEALDRPPIISVLSIAEIMEIKSRSPGAKYGGGDNPWNQEKIGFPAMASKSSKRRLARSTPLITSAPQFMMAAAMEEAHEERGLVSYIDPARGVVASPFPTAEPSETPSAEDLTTKKKDPLYEPGMEAAKRGIADLEVWFKSLPPDDRNRIFKTLEAEMKPAALKVDGPLPTNEAEYQAFTERAIERSAAPAKWIDSARHQQMRKQCSVTIPTYQHLADLIIQKARG